jgi:hypothetical protein
MKTTQKGKTMTNEQIRRVTALSAAVNALADRLDETLALFAEREDFDRVSFVLTIACFKGGEVTGATVANVSQDDTLDMLKAGVQQMQRDAAPELQLMN